MGGMNLKTAIAGSVLLALLALFAAYVAGYFLLCEPEYPSGPFGCIRVYDSEWMAHIFTPAAELESLVTDDLVVTSHRGKQ
jgi:hypothetical protein